MFAGERPPVATWYKSGWKRWKFRLSTSVTRTGLPASDFAQARPPNPPPRINTLRLLSASNMEELAEHSSFSDFV